MQVLAEAAGLPPTHLASDYTLGSIAALRPGTTAQLKQCGGCSDAFVSQHGEVCHVWRVHLPRLPTQQHAQAPGLLDNPWQGYHWATRSRHEHNGVKGALSDWCSKPVRCLQAFVRAVVQHCEAAGLALGSQWRTPQRNSGDWTRFRNQVDCRVVQRAGCESLASDKPPGHRVSHTGHVVGPTRSSLRGRMHAAALCSGGPDMLLPAGEQGDAAALAPGILAVVKARIHEASLHTTCSSSRAAGCCPCLPLVIGFVYLPARDSVLQEAQTSSQLRFAAGENLASIATKDRVKPIQVVTTQ